MNREAVEKGISGTGLIFDRPNDDSLVIYLTGGWQTGRSLPGADEVHSKIEADPRIRSVSFDTSGLTGIAIF